MRHRLIDIIRWVEAEGPPKALNRIRLKLLSRTLRERISLDACDEHTEVSQEYLEAFADAAAEIVGKPLPTRLPRA